MITDCNGYLVTLTAGAGYFQHSYSDEWAEALECYQEPPRGWQAVAISACVDGVPVEKLSAHTVAEMRRAA